MELNKNCSILELLKVLWCLLYICQISLCRLSSTSWQSSNRITIIKSLSSSSITIFCCLWIYLCMFHAELIKCYSEVDLCTYLSNKFKEMIARTAQTMGAAACSGMGVLSTQTPSKSIVVITGPSGCGKSTLLNRLFDAYPDRSINVFKLWMWLCKARISFYSCRFKNLFPFLNWV